MVSSELERLQRRARRAYEWGRLRAALPGALHAVGVTVMAAVLQHRLKPSVLMLGALLVLLCLGLGWWGRQWNRAVAPGLAAGLFPLLLPFVVSGAGHVCYTGGCRAFCLMTCVGGGLAAGAVLAFAALRLREGHERFLLASGTVATLCGALGCVLYGLSGVLGLVAGLALVSMPVLVLRRA
ncbi:hypothetical protein BO221_19285 [Archangium sp. Cb G35]|uniref:hypothetical protein n=1 Tax=Archangium sp. Cb G35 TaxID=1920190 RepID=UPI000937721A|nr:hypothetical protein [Archangium sp. Cb G35]OJT23034.1 hypothetical protein BO221_19285 [Archangium sp. Cb G35]